MDIFSTELGIWHRFVKISEFIGGEGVEHSENPPPPSVRHCRRCSNATYVVCPVHYVLLCFVRNENCDRNIKKREILISKRKSTGSNVKSAEIKSGYLVFAV
jgi:hypothetical protein